VIVTEICTAPKEHAQIEEEIFYPAVKAALKDKVLVPGAILDLIDLGAQMSARKAELLGNL
jgi:hypothetical protein